MKCLKCGGGCWDNTEKNNARAEVGEKLMPDYSCKDKEGCGWVKWRPKDGSKEIILETKAPKSQPKANEPPNGYVESKEKNTHTLARTQLMVQCIQTYGDTNLPFDLKLKFQEFWAEIIKC